MKPSREYNAASEAMMNARAQIHLPQELLAGFCRRNGIRRMALFGSVLRDDFRPDSDVDVLVEFEAGKTPGLMGLAGMEEEFGLLIGRKVDLNTPGFFNPKLRAQIEAGALPQYG